MCILFIAIKQHQNYPLIICANRDEFYKRPTKAAHYWSDNSNILAGKDLLAGGSWLGVNKAGLFAAVTNIRTGKQPAANKLSRGNLVTDVLQNHAIINSKWLSQQSDKYNPFNLIYGSSAGLFCFNSINKQQLELSDGFHAISNGSLNEIWPKMANGEKQLELIVKSSETIHSDELFSFLKDQSQAPDENLPNTGVPLEWERLLSSIFICSKHYGTRSSTIVLQKSDHCMEFCEVQYEQQGKQFSKKTFFMTII